MSSISLLNEIIEHNCRQGSNKLDHLTLMNLKNFFSFFIFVGHYTVCHQLSLLSRLTLSLMRLVIHWHSMVTFPHMGECVEVFVHAVKVILDI